MLVILSSLVESCLAKHLQIYNPLNEGDPPCFKFNIHKQISNPLWRACTDAVWIKNIKADLVMNGKSKFLHPAIPRVMVTRGNEDLVGAHARSQDRSDVVTRLLRKAECGQVTSVGWWERGKG